MKYFLRTNQGNTGFEEISEDYYNSLKNSFCCLLNAYQIEQKYDLIVANYIELESEFNSVLVNHLVGRYPGWINHLEVQLAINRRLANFLSTCKTYGDQRDRHIILCFAGDKSVAREVKNFASAIYDNNPDYRLMEALRNHVQHSSLAVHESTIGGRRASDSIESDFEYKAGFYLKKEEIQKNKKFKSTVRDEMPDKVEIISSVRSYMSGLSEIHAEARRHLDPKVEEASLILNEADGSCESGNSWLAKSAFCVNSTDEVMESVPIGLSHHEEIEKLKKKNLKLVKIDRGHFSSNPFD